MNIDNGKYRAKALSAAVTQAKTGNKQIAIQFELLDHPGRSITYYKALSDACLQYAIDALRACGWQGCDLTDLSGLDSEVVIVVKNEEYPEGSGKWTAKVQFVNAANVALQGALAGDDLASFAAQMKAKILALDPSRAKQIAAAKPKGNGAAATRPEPPHPADSEMPF
jgi:hypothetical protein